MRPLIGITTYPAPGARGGPGGGPGALLRLASVRGVPRAGGRPLLIPPSDNGIAETLDVLDGIVFSGGSDLDPDTYGEEPHPATGDLRPERDDAELELMTAALERDLPMLAICRGSQLLNVARGGDLVQHLPEIVGDDKHKVTPGLFATHDVAVEPGSRLGGLIGTAARVESHHHQGLGRVGEGLEVVAYAEDGTAEAVEDGVLWHPEEGEDLRLFEALVEEAKAYRQERRR